MFWWKRIQEKDEEEGKVFCNLFLLLLFFVFCRLWPSKTWQFIIITIMIHDGHHERDEQRESKVMVPLLVVIIDFLELLWNSHGHWLYLLLLVLLFSVSLRLLFSPWVWYPLSFSILIIIIIFSFRIHDHHDDDSESRVFFSVSFLVLLLFPCLSRLGDSSAILYASFRRLIHSSSSWFLSQDTWLDCLGLLRSSSSKGDHTLVSVSDPHFISPFPFPHDFSRREVLDDSPFLTSLTQTTVL